MGRHMRLDEFERLLPGFREWLEEKGIQVLPKHQDNELLRFKANNIVSVAYITKKMEGRMQFQGEMGIAMSAFMTGLPWDVVRSGFPGGKRAALLQIVLHRDGLDCFFCIQPMDLGDTTIEHLLSRKYGGSGHPANIVAAHKRCNSIAGTLSIVEKFQIRSVALKAKENGIEDLKKASENLAGDCYLYGLGEVKYAAVMESQGEVLRTLSRMKENDGNAQKE